MSRDGLRRAALGFVSRGLPEAPPARNPPRRLLLIRPDHLGDVLLTSPAVGALRARLPDAKLTLMVGPWAVEVARRGADVDEILTCEFPGFARRPKRTALEPYLKLIEEARELRGHFDLAVIARPDHWWGALLAALARIPTRIGYHTPNTAPFLTEKLPLPQRAHATELSMILAERAIEIASPVPRVRAGPRILKPVFKIKPDERRWAAELERGAGSPMVMLHPGSGSTLKSWPCERWADVADQLTQAGARIVLTGGLDELNMARRIEGFMRSQPLVLAGQTELGQLAALAEKCALAVGTDNGPLHLACAVGTPTLRIYGPTDEAIFGPSEASAEHTVLTHSLPCRPCGNLISPPCGSAEEPPCMLGVQGSEVVQRALALVNRLAARARPEARLAQRHSDRGW